MFSNLTKLSFFGKHKVKDGMSFNSIVSGDKITFSVYDNNQILLFESFNNIDELKDTISGKILNERELFFKNLVCFLCDIKEDAITKPICESEVEENKSIDDLENSKGNIFVQTPQNSINTTNAIDSSNNLNTTTEVDDKDDGILDDIHAGSHNLANNIGHLLKPNTPKIYAFITSKVPNAVKIGFTVKTAEQRIDQWKQKYPDAELINWWPATLFVNNVKSYFKDFPVHAETIERGFDNLAQIDFAKDVYFSKEFFRRMSRGENSKELTKEIITEIIDVVKDEIINKTRGKNYISYNLEDDSKTDEREPNEVNFKNTPLQDEAIQEGIRIYKSGQSKMLLAAVMRFGKTHVAYSIAKGVGAKFVLVSSAKVNTKAEWRNGIYHVNFRNAVFVEFNGKYDLLVSDRMLHWYKHPVPITSFSIDDCISAGKMVIVFASLQDLSGKSVKEDAAITEAEVISRLLEMSNSRLQKERHKEIFNRENDLFIIDETHYGARGATYGKVTRDDEDDRDDVADKDDADAKKLDNKVKEIPTKCQLHLSGTPYQIMTTGEFNEDQIVGRYSYTDMVDARDEWIAKNVVGDDEDENYTGPKESDSPFFGIPDVIRFGMKLTKKCRAVMRKQEREENLDSKLSYLFGCIPNKLEFMFEPAIIELGEAIFGGDKICGFLKEDDITRGEIFKHTVAVMPSVKACHTFRNLLKKYKLIDKDREIIVAVENEDTPRMDTCAENVNDLNIKLQSLENEGKKSLTLTCNRLMTGASVPLWDSMLYMKDTDSAQEYDQAVFRICTRNVKTFRSGDKTEKVNLKPHVYLIDFKIDRMFKIIGDSARAISDVKKQRGLENLKTNVTRDLSKLPLYVEWKSTGMGKVDPEDFMEYYTKYSKNNSIDDIIKNGINKFDVNKFNTDILNIISKFNKGSLHVNNKVDANKGEGENDTKFKTLDASNNLVLDDKGDLVSQNKAPKSKKEEEEKKNRLVSLLKNILYMVICFDGKIDSLIDLIDAIKNDEVKEETARIFLGDNPVGILNKLNTDLDTPALNEIDSEIMSINLLLNDESMTDAERMDVAIKKLGKLDKNEVVTPPSIAKRMIEKLDDSYYEKAERILEVNSKTGEFVREIYIKYGPEVAKKVKIVASSEMTKQFIRKILNLLGLPEYNLLNITANSDFVKVKGKMSEKYVIEYRRIC